MGLSWQLLTCVIAVSEVIHFMNDLFENVCTVHIQSTFFFLIPHALKMVK